MSWRPSAPGSQLRKWSNDRFSIISTTTCSTPSEPCGASAGAALAAVWDKNSEPVIATPVVDAAINCKKTRRVSMQLSMNSNGHDRQANHHDGRVKPG